jgi:hypothetical protein
MNSYLNKYFGPLPEEYCVYFLALSVFFGILFFLGLIWLIYYVIAHYKKLNRLIIAQSIAMLINTLLAYFVNRLLNTMCVRSI